MSGDSENGPVAGNDGKPPHPVYNWMSVISASIAAVSASAVAFFLLIGALEPDESGYAGLILLPPLLVVFISLGFFVGGWMRERRRQKRSRHSSFFETWVVDPWAFVRGRGPGALLISLIVGTFLLLGAGAGSMAFVEFTESNTFCTGACHETMGPEATAHGNTAHAQIDCVECHSSPGAEGFLRAKLGGLRQLYALATDQVARPIPTPIHGGTISRELCEGCHAANQDKGYTTLNRAYFLADEDVTPVRLAMVVKVGGNSGLLKGAGIHYHMQIASKVEYIARDPQRQEIAWVRVTHGDDVREFELESEPLTEDERANLEVRVMECVDCHSRPAHRFKSPVDSVNLALRGDVLSRRLPSIKESAVAALDGSYESTPAAMAGIDQHIRDFYDEEYPDEAEELSEEIDRSIDTLRTIYAQTIFPEMKADWTTHPNNLGHRDSVGCFRCHNDEMVDEDGEPIFTDCTACHAILAQDDEVIRTMEDFELGQGFVHPEDWDTVDEFTLCSDCHTGGYELYE